MEWEKKLELLKYISSDLQIIHENDIIHCDLHSGNIFQNDLHNAYIGDLGIAKSINKTLDKEVRGIYGSLPYVAPEVLRGNPFTNASDIYSFGMLMWEISSGSLVFSDYKDDGSNLIVEICFNELRPNILKGTATCYANLLKKCWDKDPNKRPSAIEIHETILSWKNNPEILLEFLKSDKEMVIENNGFIDTVDNTIYTSQLLSYIN
ncbi:kinase-like domain-containing protein [Gigaspora rosea]|uniref:Kinase-like domain-containing protein n=1 Tax=Gigaspora rosea TaxID=44941 RepID=A0A397UCX1_9GLOM|nr:kinase-like domain-containing protein [Gigaspora rosea]